MGLHFDLLSHFSFWLKNDTFPSTLGQFVLLLDWLDCVITKRKSRGVEEDMASSTESRQAVL